MKKSQTARQSLAPTRKKKVIKLKYPKHPGPMHVGGRLPLSHYTHRYISEAELPPNREERAEKARKSKYLAPWKYPPPTSKGAELTENEKRILSPLFDPPTETKDAIQIEQNQPVKPGNSLVKDNWKLVGQPFLVR
jgi:hypothetical protein